MIVVAALAFALGFYVSEYRHANNTLHQQVIAEVAIDDAPFISPIETPSQAASSIPVAPATDYLPTRPQTPIERANQLIANGAYGEAVRLLTKLLEQNPQYTEALWLLARVYEQQGQHEESVTTWFRYINTEVDAQKIDNALAYLAKYLIRLTENPSIFGESYAWLMAQINDLIKLTPDNGELHLQLAKMHLKIADKEQAQYHALMAANQPETRNRPDGILAKLAEG